MTTQRDGRPGCGCPHCARGGPPGQHLLVAGSVPVKGEVQTMATTGLVPLTGEKPPRGEFLGDLDSGNAPQSLNPSVTEDTRRGFSSWQHLTQQPDLC